MTTVCVIGGGIAGLAAAHRLVGHGAEVVLLERDRLGGKIRTSEFAGRHVDEAADAFLVRVPWALGLANELGLDGQLVSPAARNAFVYAGGTLRRLPEAQLLGVPADVDEVERSGILSPSGLEALRRDLDEPGPGPDGDEAIGPFIRRRLGSEVLDKLVGPLVGGINAGDVETLSLAAVAPQIDAAARDASEASLVRAAAAVRSRGAAAAAPSGLGSLLPSDGPAPVFAAPKRGMGHFVDTLVTELAATGVAVRLGAAAEAIEAGAGGWIVHDSAGKTLDADAVVIAVPAAAAGGLLEPHTPRAAAFLASIQQASVALVTLAVPVAEVGHALDGSGFLVPHSPDLLVTACSWTSSKWAHLAPEAGDGTVLLRASVGRANDRRFLDLDDAELTEAVVRDLEQTMQLRGAPAGVRISRWPRSLPQYAPGHLDQIATTEAELAEVTPTIRLAGATLRGVGIPACINSGQIAADGVLAALSSR